MAVNFSFVIEGKLAGMGLPGSWSPLEADLRFLREQGVRGVVSLTEEPLDAAALRKSGLSVLHLPVRDITAPTMAQVQSFEQFVDDTPGAVVVHCRAGMGRTGTMLACYFVWSGKEPEAAIAEVRRKRPCSIETAEQEAVVHEYARFLDSRQDDPA